MAEPSYSILDRDCSLDLAEAASLIDLVYIVFEHADNKEDWFAARAAIGSGLFAAEKAVRAALTRVEGAPSVPEQRAH